MSDLTPWTKEGREQIWGDLQARMNSLQNEINRAFDGLVGQVNTGWGNVRPFLADSEKYLRQFVPSINIKESDKEITVTAEIPGLDQKDIHVTHTDKELILEGEKKTEKKENSEKMRLVESSYGSFRRVIGLPQEIDFSKINASFKNGVLTVVLPKTAQAQAAAKKVEVKAG